MRIAAATVIQRTNAPKAESATKSRSAGICFGLMKCWVPGSGRGSVASAVMPHSLVALPCRYVVVMWQTTDVHLNLSPRVVGHHCAKVSGMNARQQLTVPLLMALALPRVRALRHRHVLSALPDIVRDLDTTSPWCSSRCPLSPDWRSASSSSAAVHALGRHRLMLVGTVIAAAAVFAALALTVEMLILSRPSRA